MLAIYMFIFILVPVTHGVQCTLWCACSEHCRQANLKEKQTESEERKAKVDAEQL